MVDKMSNGFEDLDVWKMSLMFSKKIYQLTSAFPSEEKFGLSNQMRRASVSIMSNIAEGSARNSTRDFLRFINIAIGSSAEVKSQLLLAHELGFINPNQLSEYLDDINQIGRMLKGLQRSFMKSLDEVDV